MEFPNRLWLVAWKCPWEFGRLGWCARDVWIGIGVVSKHLQIIDEQLLLLMERKTQLLGRVALGSGFSLKDKLTKINEQILDLEGAGQWL